QLTEENPTVCNVHYPTSDDYLALVNHYENLAGPLLPIMAAGGYWGGQEHARLLGRCLARLANPPGAPNRSSDLGNLRSYPALLLLYAGGIGAVLAERYD